MLMTEATLAHMHTDLEVLKQDIAVIKHILSEEGRLTDSALKLLQEARAIPDSEYIKHADLKKRVFL